MKKQDPKVNFYKCPICQNTCGIRSGNMPAGSMKWQRQKFGRIEGEQDSDGIIQIDYRFSGGKIPGSSDYYRPDGRTAYLPYNKRGRIALSMLIEAFKRKLTFNVGTSLTTSEKNVIVWAGIHHKTS